MPTIKASVDRCWIQILALGISIAFGLALLMATLGVAAGAIEEETGQATDASGDQTYEGMISDTNCGARHQPSIAKNAADCARVCVHGGAQFALIVGDNTYALEGDIAQLKKNAGQRARIVGSLSGNTITVSTIAGE